MGKRSAVALQESGVGPTELFTLAERSDPELQPTEAQRALLDLTDRYLEHGSRPPDELIERLNKHFAAEELCEALLRLLHYSSNRIRVALRFDLDEVTVRPFAPEVVERRVEGTS